MKIDEYLSQRLTNDKHAEVIEENYRGLMEVEGVDRDPFQEMYIKLNRLERLMTPAKPEIEHHVYDDEIVFANCPNCRHLFEVGFDESEHCPSCGQALDWSEVEE